MAAKFYMVVDEPFNKHHAKFQSPMSIAAEDTAINMEPSNLGEMAFPEPPVEHLVEVVHVD